MATSIYECMYKGGLKSSYDEVISAVDGLFFYQWDPSTATPIEGM